ncbi:hypothetical protein O0L34_g4008 [Tuta absoluta]|nr:hypothetical protein O0L34_g4008 [Tuta absoluta]
MECKTKVFNTCILPCITYGCQSWALNQKSLNSLKVCQQNMERSILGVKRSDKKKLSYIRSHTKVKDISVCIRKLKWKWAGHMARDKTGKWTRDVIQWYPRNGKRGRGRPYIRWDDDLKKVAGSQWMRKAQDRKTWKEMEEAYAGQAD